MVQARHAERANRAAEAATAERQHAARQHAEATRLAIERCRQCDDTGYLPGGHLCPHDPAVAGRAKRGAAAARAALTGGQP